MKINDDELIDLEWIPLVYQDMKRNATCRYGKYVLIMHTKWNGMVLTT